MGKQQEYQSPQLTEMKDSIIAPLKNMQVEPCVHRLYPTLLKSALCRKVPPTDAPKEQTISTGIYSGSWSTSSPQPAL